MTDSKQTVFSTSFVFPGTADGSSSSSSSVLKAINADDVEEQRTPSFTEGAEQSSNLGPRGLSGVGFLIWYAVITCTLGIVAPMAFVYTNNEWDRYQTRDWLSLFVSFSPLVGLEIALGVPALQESFKNNFVSGRWQSLMPVALLVASAWTSSSLFYEEFNPLSMIFIAATAFGALGSLQLLGRLVGTADRSGQVFDGALTFVDLALWCLLFIPLDYRWYNNFYWFGAPGLGYDWWALAITVLGVVGWGPFRGLEGFGYRLVPTPKDVGIGVAGLLALGSVVIPLGLLTGFLQWPPDRIPTAMQVFTLWLENALTVAITEELFFRMVLMNGINVSVKDNKNGWVGLLVSSLFFGLMHWPRRNGHPTQQLIYASLAFVSGIVYGQAYRLSGNNIVAAVLAHSLTDTTWAFVFSG